MVDLSIDLPNGFLNEEPRTLIVSRRRKEVWAVELDLLVQLDRVCKKHGIRYFCDGGTVLGAVRHGGFVPWDDDIDIIMSRTEYEKLNAIAPTEFKHPYFWQTNATDPGSARGHAQLRNSATTGILKSEMRNGKPLFRFNQGLFIDVFPFDNLPDDPEQRRQFLKRVWTCKKRIERIVKGHVALTDIRTGRLSPRVLFRGAQMVMTSALPWFSGQDALTAAVQTLDTTAQSCRHSVTSKVAPVTLDPFHREVLPSCFLDEAVEVDFEFLKIPVMAHHLESLQINYGPNWREHVVGASAHGGMFIDTDRPYTEYIPK